MSLRSTTAAAARPGGSMWNLSRRMLARCWHQLWRADGHPRMTLSAGAAQENRWVEGRARFWEQLREGEREAALRLRHDSRRPA